MARSHLQLAQRIAEELVERHGEEILAVGVMGSVALGEEGPYSDVDMFVLASRHGSWDMTMRHGVIVAGLWRTPDEAEKEITEPSHGLLEVLSGWWSLKILHDPTEALQRLAKKARRPSPELFAQSAREALLGAFEDFGKLRNALEAGNLEEAAEMSIWFSGAAAGVLACLLRHVPHSGKTLFAELRGLSPLGEAIHRLRYRPAETEDVQVLAEGLWKGLLEKAQERGISIDDLTELPSSHSS